MDCPVASNGDITLIVGPDKMRICVQSAILSISSKPFAAMLSPTWKAPDVKTVDLPDDDAEAMLEICHALHKNYDKLQTRPTPETLLEIAILADKYFLLSPLASIAKRFWLVGKDHPRPYTIKSDGFLGMMQATAAAKMFDACVFATYTGELVCHWGLSYVIGSPGCADLFMTESLSSKLYLT